MFSKVLTGDLTFKSLKPPDLSCCTKQQLREYFENSYELNESIFTALKDDSVLYKCPDRLRLPLIFYFCHTAVVYANKLYLAGLIKDRVNRDLETIFETGVDEMSWDDTENYRMGGSYQWPTVEETVEYRRVVKNLVLKLIQDTPLELPITMESPWWALLMGIEHERIHIETSSVLIRQLPVDMVTKPDEWIYGPMKSGEPVTSNPMVKVDKREITYGKPFNFPSYGWDNEYGEVTCSVPSFEASKFKVTNGEFLEFVEDGGYEKKDFWSEEGWRWKQFRQAKHPVFWVCNEGCKGGCGGDLANYSHCHFPQRTEPNSDVINGNGVSNGHQNGTAKKYMYRAMFDVIEFPMDWPVDVNYLEAQAFCKWKGQDYRLPIEAEINIIRGPMMDPKVGVKCDIIYQKSIEANTNLQYGSSTPVNMYPSNELGFHDVFGNVWEWTEDHFNGLCNYESHWLYDDFSSPCFDGRHNIILGGSWVSTGDEASRFARYAFRRHFFQHAGFRLARTIRNKEEKVNLPARLVDSEVFVLGVGVEDNPITLDPKKYECTNVATTNKQYKFDTEPTLYGILEQEFGFRDAFPAVIANHCMKLQHKHKIGTKSAVWLGAGTGRGPFELTSTFQNVLGVDFGGRFIDTALKIQRGEEVQFTHSNGKTMLAQVNGNSKMEKAVFKQLTWIPNEIFDNDMTIITFLDRTMNPKAWLERLWEITLPSGMVVVASTDKTWNRESLMPFLGKKLKLKESAEMAYESPEGKKVAMVTAWSHK
ncbi:hypothetical protein FSP39_006572 [Pinctada imbricata]|uniref:5-histidylcysteine sulfoxide synthase n=1 Tax=Pinctada imbricata TaxID=66713 RepID=A0AA88XPE6_PINIB|nr:hypothetical protein FSP39_006572 [Pinctada imbricata]